MIFTEVENENQNQNLNNSPNEEENNLVLTKYVVDFSCSSYSTLCFTDENEVYLWGKNIIDESNE